jgi:hypothetical protein
MVELCSARTRILEYDEATLMEQAKNLNATKMLQLVKEVCMCVCARARTLQNGLLMGLMHVLFLSLSAHVTQQLGMAPGGEFRAAYQEVSASAHAHRSLHTCSVW